MVPVPVALVMTMGVAPYRAFEMVTV